MYHLKGVVRKKKSVCLPSQSLVVSVPGRGIFQFESQVLERCVNWEVCSSSVLRRDTSSKNCFLLNVKTPY